MNRDIWKNYTWQYIQRHFLHLNLSKTQWCYPLASTIYIYWTKYSPTLSKVLVIVLYRMIQERNLGQHVYLQFVANPKSRERAACSIGWDCQRLSNKGRCDSLCYFLPYKIPSLSNTIIPAIKRPFHIERKSNNILLIPNYHDRTFIRDSFVIVFESFQLIRFPELSKVSRSLSEKV